MGDMIKCSKCCTYHYMNDPCVEFDVEPSFYCPQCLQDSTDSELQENEGYCRLCCQQNQQDLFLKDVLSTELEAARAANLTYHDRTELSSTQVAKFMDDPIAFYEMHVTGERKREAPTEAMKFGTSVHEMIELGGPDKMPIAVIPREVLNKDGHKRGKAWTQWKAEQPDDALLYKEGEAIPWTKIWVSLLANEECVPWLASDRKEEEFYWQDSASGLQCRAKLDVVDASKIVDWKTTRSVDPRGFQSACHSMHYAERLSFYRRGYEQKYGDRPPCVAVAIENSGSYRVQPYEISESWLSKADDNLSRVLDQIANFDIQLERNKPIIELSEPKYARFDDEFQLDQV